MWRSVRVVMVIDPMMEPRVMKPTKVATAPVRALPVTSPAAAIMSPVAM